MVLKPNCNDLMLPPWSTFPLVVQPLSPSSLRLHPCITSDLFDVEVSWLSRNSKVFFLKQQGTWRILHVDIRAHIAVDGYWNCAFTFTFSLWFYLPLPLPTFMLQHLIYLPSMPHLLFSSLTIVFLPSSLLTGLDFFFGITAHCFWVSFSSDCLGVVHVPPVEACSCCQQHSQLGLRSRECTSPAATTHQ